MSDLPVQGNFQQLHAQPIAGEHLEVLGKQASSVWQSGECSTLSDAVVRTVKEAGLSPEQVRRVIEFANTDAYLSEFKKEGAHKVVDFGAGGPASPAEVLRDLNDGGGGSVFDRGTLDYDQPPRGTKLSSAPAEQALGLAFHARDEELYPFVEPLRDAMDLRDKLASADDHMRAEVGGLEIMYADVADRVYREVKQAAMNGASLGDVMQVWDAVAPSAEHIKVAFQLLAPRLLREQVFPSLGAMHASVEKTASGAVVNREHPLATEFGEYCDILSKLASTRDVREEVRLNLGQITAFLKEASAVGKVYGVASRGSKGLADAVAPVVGKVLGEPVGGLTHFALRNAHNVAAGVGAAEVYNHVQHSQAPAAKAVRRTGNVILRNVPGTQQNLQHNYELESGQ